MGIGNLFRAPPAAVQRYTTGELGKVQGWDCVGIVEGSCGSGGSAFVENSFN